MKISIMSHCFYKEFAEKKITMNEFIKYCSDLKVDGVELSDHHMEESDFVNLQSKLKDFNLELASYTIVTDFVQPDDKARDEAVQDVIRKIDRASLFNAKRIMMSPGGPKEGLSNTQVRSLITDGLIKVSEHASRKNMILSMENHGGHANLRGKPEHMLEFVSNVPSMYITYDDGNYVLAGADTLTALDELYGKTVHVHLKDYMLIDDKDLNTNEVNGKERISRYSGVPIGEGIVPTFDVLRKLKKNSYTGYISIEYIGKIPPEAGIKRSYENILDLIKKL